MHAHVRVRVCASFISLYDLQHVLRMFSRKAGWQPTVQCATPPAVPRPRVWKCAVGVGLALLVLLVPTCWMMPNACATLYSSSVGGAHLVLTRWGGW